MNNWKRATGYFLLGYFAATVGGFGLYFLASEAAMWLFTMTLMPALFLVLAYKYFRKNLASASPLIDHDLLWLTAYWVVLFCVMDALIYVFLSPWSLGSSPNWTFFRDQSPWIWVNYVTVVVIVLVGKTFYYKKKQPQTSLEGAK